MKLRENFYLQQQTLSAGERYKVEAQHIMGRWAARVYKLPQDRVGGGGRSVWGKVYRDSRLVDPDDGDAVCERAWQQCCKELDLE